MSNLDYLVTLCPECKQVTEYHTNPAYMHICRNKDCGYKTTQSKLITAVDTKIAEIEVASLEQRIKNIKANQKKFPEAPKE